MRQAVTHPQQVPARAVKLDHCAAVRLAASWHAPRRLTMASRQKICGRMGVVGSRRPWGQGFLMTPEGRMRAAEAPKSCAESRDTKEIAPPPGTGWPRPVNWIG